MVSGISESIKKEVDCPLNFIAKPDQGVVIFKHPANENNPIIQGTEQGAEKLDILCQTKTDCDYANCVYRKELKDVLVFNVVAPLLKKNPVVANYTPVIKNKIIDLMANDPEQQEKCPLKFSYITFSNGYLVHSDFFGTVDDRVYIGASGKENLKTKCSARTDCDHTKCAYHKELIYALEATTTYPRPKDME